VLHVLLDVVLVLILEQLIVQLVKLNSPSQQILVMHAQVQHILQVELFHHVQIVLQDVLLVQVVHIVHHAVLITDSPQIPALNALQVIFLLEEHHHV
jgi:hypothetical protein